MIDQKCPGQIGLRQLEYIYSTCGQFTKNKERIQKFKETGDSRHFYQNELDKACFQHDMANGDFKDSTRRTASDKTFNIDKNPKYDGCQRSLASMVYKFLIRKNILVVLLKFKICQTKN